MGDASYQWTSFLGGEWSGFAQGRIDLPAYLTAVNLSRNGMPMEEGSWTRRGGRRRLGPTAFNASGKVLTFWLPNHQPVICEFTYSNAVQQSFLRFWTNTVVGAASDDLIPLCDNYAQIVTLSGDTPAILTIAAAPPASMNGNPTWGPGDEIVIYVDPSIPLANGPAYVGRQFRIVPINPTQYQLYDAITGAAFSGGQVGAGFAQYGNSFAGHIVRFGGPWKSLAEVKSITMTQTGPQAFIFSGASQPYELALTSVPNAPPFFVFAPAAFQDGPYLDPLPGNSQTGNSLGAIAPYSYGQYMQGQNLQFFVTDGAYTFQASDVGRKIRLWSQPRPWNGGGYGVGTYQRVTWQGNFYATTTNKGTTQTPGTGTDWYLEQDFGRWGYGTITAIGWDGNNQSCTVALDNLGGPGGGLDNGTIVNNLQGGQDGNQNPLGGDGGTGIIGGDAIIDTWQLGVYTAGQYPTSGMFLQGRLVMGGAVPNRTDASMSDGGSYGGFLSIPSVQDPSLWPAAQSGSQTTTLAQAVFGVPQWGTSASLVGSLGVPPSAPLGGGFSKVYFTPTDANGQVRDNHGISAILNDAQENQISWLIPYHEGAIAGTVGGEFHIGAASSPEAAITPSDIKVTRVTRYGAKAVVPLSVGMALVFVQTAGQRLMEYVIDVFSRRFQGRHLNEYAKHLTTAGITQIAYQEEKIPIVWACMADGTLASCTYRRFVSGFVQADPAFMGWAAHPFADGRYVISVTMGADTNGLDKLVLMTTDGIDA